MDLYDSAKAELEEIHENVARGAMIRSKADYIEKGEKPTKFFLSLEKSSVSGISILDYRNPLIMDYRNPLFIGIGCNTNLCIFRCHLNDFRTPLHNRIRRECC